jgi:hypothetical protein
MARWPFDVVVIGADENRKYLDFWPHVAYAYRTLFPGVQPVLALVTRRPHSDSLLRELSDHGEVSRVTPLDDYPMSVQAKLARFLVAGSMQGRVCYIDDLDEIPIDRDWHLHKLEGRLPGSLLLVGREVYGSAYPDQVPVSQMTAEGHVFERLFAMDRLQRDGLVKWYEYLHSLRVDDEDHTNVRLPTFSDEALIVRLRQEHPVPEYHVARGYQVGVDTIDRAYWPYSKDRLEAGKYVTAHTARPYLEYKEGNDAIIEYIRRRYNGGPMPKSLS